MLKLSHQEFKTAIINMLKALVNKVDSKQEQMGNLSRDGDPRKNQKEML